MEQFEGFQIKEMSDAVAHVENKLVKRLRGREVLTYLQDCVLI